jgi:hypothetical protein
MGSFSTLPKKYEIFMYLTSKFTEGKENGLNLIMSIWYGKQAQCDIMDLEVLRIVKLQT